MERGNKVPVRAMFDCALPASKFVTIWIGLTLAGWSVVIGTLLMLDRVVR
jgi:hypothetical protein